MKKEEISIINVALESGITPEELLKCLGTDHIKEGYKGNIGKERCIRKNGSFDYLKMSDLFHSGNW